MKANPKIVQKKSIIIKPEQYKVNIPDKRILLERIVPMPIKIDKDNFIVHRNNTPEKIEIKETKNIEILEIEDEREKEEKQIKEINRMIKLPKKEMLNSQEYNKLIIKILGNLQESNEFYSKIEKDIKGKINPRIPGIFIMFDNINFYFQQFQKFQFFDNFKTSIPKNIDKVNDLEKIFSDIEDYIKNNTNIQPLLNSNKINMDDIISDYILYFIEKRDKLSKDSCDIKYFYKILYNMIQIKKKNLYLDNYKYFIEIIILFNCFGSHITYPLNAIKYLNDEKIIKDIYTKILKEIEQYDKENNIIAFKGIG